MAPGQRFDGDHRCSGALVYARARTSMSQWVSSTPGGFFVVSIVTLQGVQNYDNDIGDVKDESPVEGLYNPQMEGKAGKYSQPSGHGMLFVDAFCPALGSFLHKFQGFDG